MSRAEDTGAAIGRALAALVPKFLREHIRSHYAAKYGRCRRCGAPLGGPSRVPVCGPCHVDETLARGMGGTEGGEA